MARAVEDYYGNAQDIEWAIDEKGVLHLLQARPITTEGTLSFLPPGEGYWSFDPTHNPRPVTPWFQQKYTLDKCTANARRMGSLFVTMKLRYVHQFAFSQPQFSPPSPALERAADAYWSKKLYEDDYREFCDFFRPQCEALQVELREINPSSLSHKSLIEHVARCYDLAGEFWALHHTYTMPALVVVGDFMNRMAGLTGKDVVETLSLLEGVSPESRGLLNREDPLLQEMYELLEESEQAIRLLNADEDRAAWALDCLLHMPGELGEIMRQVVIIYGWRLTGNYDLVTPALIESPYFFIKTIQSGLNEAPDEARKLEQRIQNKLQEWKDQLPADRHDEFDEILDVGRRFFRMRDERGLCTDLSGIGLCRRGLLEAGQRLTEQGVLVQARHLCVATKQEAVALLRGDLGLLSHGRDENGITSASSLSMPTPRELERRYSYIVTANPNLIPKGLGTPPPPPENMALPAGIGRTMAAFDTALLRGMMHQWHDGEDDEEDDDDDIDPNAVKPKSVKGVAASIGIVEGPCCLVIHDGDLQKVQKGDVVVTYSCSASFNVVLGLCAGICTDYGGVLSHAAIVAREYGIPAVVGTQEGTAKFNDGDIIRVDCSTATVKLVKRKEEATSV
jgi:phosphohistidine swiveling domain-containing protein